MNKHAKRMRCHIGFTFVELMVALAINIFVFGVLITIFVSNLNHYRTNIQISRLNEQLETTMALMTNDIKRAGYWANANSDIGLAQNNNPFVASGADLAINAGSNCILFTYDHDNNGSLPAISAGIDDEHYGFRLNGGAVQARPPGAAFDCAAASGAWENMTDTNLLTVTVLTFTPTNVTLTTGPGAQAVIIRSIDITLTGQLVSDPSITRTLIQHVRIRNDKFVP